jgi:hypothetical protein
MLARHWPDARFVVVQFFRSQRRIGWAVQHFALG